MSLHDYAEALFAAVRDYRGHEEFDDDLTLLSLRRTE
jgi:serine phosphatase RsbU (regulator of sigma subunit)